jgi:hypothetical protein
MRRIWATSRRDDVSVDVLAAPVDAVEPERLLHVRYNIGDIALTDVEFATQGFTGLHTVLHEGAELQFYCTP